MDALRLYGDPDRGDGLDALLEVPAWHTEAACAGQDTDDFYPERDGAMAAIHAARAVCAGCPVAEPCLAWALAHDEPGIWAGTTANDRQRIRRGEPLPERKAPAAKAEPSKAPCGTPAAYMRHRRRGEKACDACREAQRLKTARRRREVRLRDQEAA